MTKHTTHDTLVHRSEVIIYTYYNSAIAVDITIDNTLEKLLPLALDAMVHQRCPRALNYM